MKVETQNQIRNGIYELVFLLNQSSSLSIFISTTYLFVDFLQLLSLSFGTPDYISWGFPKLQNFFSLFLFVALDSQFYIMGVIFILDLLLLFLFLQGFVARRVQSSLIITATRYILLLLGTWCFMPSLIIHFGSLSSIIRLATSTSLSSLYSNENLATLILLLLSLLGFLGPLSLYALLSFSPDPLENKHLAAKVCTRPTLLEYFFRIFLILNSVADSCTKTRSGIHLFFMACLLVLFILYPNYSHQSINYVKAAILGSSTLVSAVAFWIALSSQATYNALQLCLFLIAFMPMAGFLAVMTVYYRLHRLNIIYFVNQQLSNSVLPSHIEDILLLLGLQVKQFISKRCRYSFDVEIASRYCKYEEEVLIGRLLFDKGLEKFISSHFLRCRYTTYLAYIQSVDPTKEHHHFVMENLAAKTAQRPLGFSSKESSIVFGMSTSHMSETSGSSFADEHGVPTLKPMLMQAQYAWGENMRQELVAKKTLDSLSQKLPIDLHFTFFYLITQGEQARCSQEAEENDFTLLDSLRFRYDLGMATYHHEKALKYGIAFWISLWKEESLPSIKLNKKLHCVIKVDPNILWRYGEIGDRFYEHCLTARFYYLKLLQRCPCSTAVADRYFEFLRGVMNDERGAHDVLRNLGAAKNERHAKGEWNEKKAHSNNEMSQDQLARGNMYGTLLSSMKNNKRMESRRMFRGMVRLVSTMGISIIFLLLGISLVFLYGTLYFLKISIDQNEPLSDARYYTQTIAYQARRMELQLTFGNQLVSQDDDLMDIIYEDSINFLNSIAQARSSSVLLNTMTVPAWSGSNFSVTYFAPGTIPINNYYDAATLFDLYGYNSISISDKCRNTYCPSDNIPLSELYAYKTFTHQMMNYPPWSFEMETGLNNILDALDLLLEESDTSIQNQMQQAQIGFWVISGVATALPLLLIAWNVSSAFVRVKKERIAILSTFCNIPKDVLQDLAGGMKLCQHRLDACISECEAKYTPTKGSRGTFSEEATEGVGDRSGAQQIPTIEIGNIKVESKSYKEVSISGDNMGSNTSSDVDGVSSLGSSDDPTLMDINDRKSKKRKPSWMILMFVFACSVSAFYAMLGISIYLLYQGSNFISYSANEIFQAETRRMSVQRVLLLAQEYIRHDYFVWTQPRDLSESYYESIQFATMIHEAIKYGNSSLGLTGSVNRYAPQDELLSQEICSNVVGICQSVDEMYNYYLDQAMSIYYASPSLRRFDATSFLGIQDLQNGVLAQSLLESKSLFLQEAQENINLLNENESIIFGLSFPLALIVMIILYQMSGKLRSNIEATRHLLEAIPFEFSTRFEPLRDYLKHGRTPRLRRRSSDDAFSEEEGGQGWKLIEALQKIPVIRFIRNLSLRKNYRSTMKLSIEELPEKKPEKEDRVGEEDKEREEEVDEEEEKREVGSYIEERGSDDEVEGSESSEEEVDNISKIKSSLEILGEKPPPATPSRRASIRLEAQEYIYSKDSPSDKGHFNIITLRNDITNQDHVSRIRRGSYG